MGSCFPISMWCPTTSVFTAQISGSHNVERCHTTSMMKYLFKYICKPPDRVVVYLERETCSVVGSVAGVHVCIPHIVFVHRDKALPFSFSCMLLCQEQHHLMDSKYSFQTMMITTLTTRRTLFTRKFSPL